MLILTAIGTFIAISPAIKIILQWLANALNSSLASTDLLTIISTAISAIVTGLTYYGFSKETTLQMKQKNLTK
jgi:hypothetical protein